MPAAIALK